MVLMADGPSLGGFVCPMTVISADLWKLGQARPGDTIHFDLTTLKYANHQRAVLDSRIALLRRAAQEGPEHLQQAATLLQQQSKPKGCDTLNTRALLHTIAASDSHPGAQYRWVLL